jgi:integrating conjugative element protein (TIGR03759 family)
VLGLTLALVAPVQADNLDTSSIATTGTTTASEQYSHLSDSERTRARSWNLSEMEWQRYRQLMDGVRGSISPETISPIEVLGIHARDESERQRYAERWAQIMHEDAERILAFQHAYDAAIRRLYPNEPLIDVSRLPDTSAKPDSLQASDRVLFFTRAECPACDALLQRLLQRLDTVAGIDIYLIGVSGEGDQAVRAWARQHDIRPDWVRNRKVTLNHDAGALEQLTAGKGEVPALMRRRGEEVSPLRAGDL